MFNLKKKFWLSLLFLTTLFSLEGSSQDCITKYLTSIPFLPTYIKPLIILDIDYSGSMRYSVYHEQSKDNNTETISYNSSKTYIGYFKPTVCYSYDENEKVWYENSNCDCSNNVGDSECVSGNLLNFLITSRFDILLKVLTGGRIETLDGNYQISAPMARNGTYILELPNGDKCFVKIGTKWGSKTSMQNTISESYSNMTINGTSCPFNFKGRRLVIKSVYIPPTERNGLLQKFYNIFDISVFSFSDDEHAAGCGKIIYPYSYQRYKTLNDLVSQIQEVYVGGETYLGESFCQIGKYLNFNLSWGPSECNSTECEETKEFNSKIIGNSTYNPASIYVDGSLINATKCRPVYLIVLTDGEWNGKVNPNDIKQYLLDSSNYLPVSKLYGVFMYGSSSGAEKLKEIVGERNFFYAQDYQQLYNDLLSIFRKVLIYSGSGVSIPTQRKKAYIGSNTEVYLNSYLLQGVFQEKYIGENELPVKWIGHLYSWWYWGTKKSSYIREDNVQPFYLNLYYNDSKEIGDNFISWSLTSDTLKIKVCPPKESGLPNEENCFEVNDFADLNPIFDLAVNLKKVDPNERVIYIPCKDTDKKLCELKLLEEPENFDLNDTLINWIYGTDYPTLRNRISDYSGNTWKLGDFIYATPLLVNYGNYTVAFVASNDGMLHAFKLGYGKITYKFYTPLHLQNSKDNPSTDEIGKELWAFIPSSSLYYEKYYASKEYEEYPHKHLYLHDLSPFLVETSDGRLILIGGLGFGGSVGYNSTAAIFSENENALSEYYALDITDPNNPKLLWEFKNPRLGFTLSGPGILKFKDKIFVVFGEGPINYEAFYQQNSNKQNTYLFILDLISGDLVKTVKLPIKNGFIGRIYQEAVDINGKQTLVFGFSNGTANRQYVRIFVNNTNNSPVQTNLDNISFKFYVSSKPVILFNYKCIDCIYNASLECPQQCNQIWSEVASCLKNETINFEDLPIPDYVKSTSEDIYLPAEVFGDKWNDIKGCFENEILPNATALFFEIENSANLETNYKYYLQLLDNCYVEPPQVGGNPYVYNGKGYDKEYWIPIYNNQYPLLVKIERNGGHFTGGLVILQATYDKDSDDLQISYKVETSFNALNGTKFNPIVSKILIANCNDRWYIFGGTGRWFFKEDDMEADSHNILFGIPLNIDESGINLGQGWAINLNNATEDFLKEKDISDPNFNENLKAVIFATTQPYNNTCSISAGRSRFWVVSCEGGNAIIPKNQQSLIGNLVTQLSTGAIVNIPLSEFKNQTSTEFFEGIPAISSPQIIVPTTSTVGSILLWLEY